MKKTFFILAVIVGISMFTYNFIASFSSSAVPGWHATIYSSGFYLIYQLLAAVTIIVIALWLFKQKVNKKVRLQFVGLFFFTIVTILLLRWPFLFNLDWQIAHVEIMSFYMFKMKYLITGWLLLFATANLFFIYSVKKKHINNLHS